MSEAAIIEPGGTNFMFDFDREMPPSERNFLLQALIGTAVRHADKLIEDKSVPRIERSRARRVKAELQTSINRLSRMKPVLEAVEAGEDFASKEILDRMWGRTP